MPRPPAKRNRLPQSSGLTKTGVSTRRNISQNDTVNDGESNDGPVTGISSNRNRRAARRKITSGSPGGKDNISGQKADLTENLDGPEVSTEDAAETRTIQVLVHQTPVVKSHGQTARSSLTGERTETEDKPVSRARGYSSNFSQVSRRGDMSSKVPGTPAFESSMLSNFRRRPRQPSILQMMQADGSSDLDDDDFLGDLSPQDESTPLKLAKGEPQLPHLSRSPSVLSLNFSGGKRKYSQIEDQEIESASVQGEHSPTRSVCSSNHSNNSGLSDRPLPAYSIQLEGFSQTMAPPLSSSPTNKTQKTIVSTPIIHSRSSRGQIHRNAAVQRSDDAGGGQWQMSTTTLRENFLPRRRRQRRTVKKGANVDILSDDSEEEAHQHDWDDDDELSRLPLKKPTKSRRKLLAESDSATNSGAKSKATNHHGRKRHVADNSSRTKSLARASSNAKVSQQGRGVTYSSRRHRNVEKENQDMNDSHTPLSSPPVSHRPTSNPEERNPRHTGRLHNQELELQAKKFAEIDKWQMDFEDIIDSNSQQTTSA